MAQSASLEHNTGLFFDPVQDSLNKHPVFPGLGSFLGVKFARQGKKGAFLVSGSCRRCRHGEDESTEKQQLSEILDCHAEA